MWCEYAMEQKILNILLILSRICFVPFAIITFSFCGARIKKLAEKHLCTEKDLAAFGKKLLLFFYDSQLYGAEGVSGTVA
jgi:hypothetical protein